VVGNQSGGPLIVAALILGVAVLAASFVVRSSLDAGTEELAGVREALGEVQVVLEEATGGNGGRAEARPQRPDPGERHQVSVDGAPVRGSADAKVTIVEFGDFQCPFCSRVNTTLAQILQQYPEDVKIVFKHLPLRIHPQAPGAHQAAEAAHRQGKFWEMHDKIFSNQSDLAPETFVAYAAQVGLDVDAFKKAVASDDVKKRVEEDLAEAQKLGVSGTPAFFINGKYMAGAQPFEAFRQRIDEELGKG
jgi:protein-disulfide isomerase